MSTVGRRIFTELLKNKGHYLDDPQVHSLWTYRDQGGKTAHKVCYDENSVYALLSSPFCTEETLFWDREGYTPEGECFLKEL